MSECEFEIVVYNENKEMSYEEVIKFELVNGECIVTLKTVYLNATMSNNPGYWTDSSINSVHTE